MSIDTEHVKELYRLAPIGLSGNICVAITISAILIVPSPLVPFTLWAIAIFSTFLYRAITIFYYQKTSVALRNENSLYWLRLTQLSSFLSGTLWGSSIYFADTYLTSDLHFIMTAVAFGLAGAAIGTLGSVLSVYLLYTVPLLSILGISMMLSVEPDHFAAGVGIVLGLVFLSVTAYRHVERAEEIIRHRKAAERSQKEVIDRLGKAGEYRDSDTGQHTQRMSHSSYLLALKAGLSESQADLILYASAMHDIGKIGIPDSILLKPGKLDHDEMTIMQTHTTLGQKILANSESNVIQLASTIAGGHHEKWDGSGYPLGLAGKEIPIEARLVSICDVFDALTSIRPYKEAWSNEKALAYIQSESGQHFDPELVSHFMDISAEVMEYNHQHSH